MDAISTISYVRNNPLSSITIPLTMSALVLLPTFTDAAMILTYLLDTIALVFIARNHNKLVRLSKLEKWFFIAIVVNFLWILFTYLLNDSPDKGHNLLWSRQIFLLSLVPLFYLYAKVSIPQRIIWLAIVISVAISLFFALRDIDPDIPGKYWDRAHGSLHPVGFGHQLFIMSMFLSFAAWEFQSLRNRIISFTFAMIGFLIVIWSQTRGAWAAFPVMPMILVFYLTRDWKPTKRIVLVLVSIIIIGGICFHPTINKRIDLTVSNIDRYFASDLTTDKSHLIHSAIGIRFQMWKAAWKTFLDRPLTGVGIGGYQENVKENADRYRVHSVAYMHYDPHNQYLSALATRGLPGLIFFLPLIILPLIIGHKAVTSGAREIKLPGLTMIGISASFMIFGLSSVPFEDKPSILLYCVLVSVMMASIRNKIVDSPDKRI